MSEYSPTVATVSGAGTLQSDATALTAEINVVNAGIANSGVRLPPIAYVGQRCSVWNATGVVINCYPASGQSLKALAVDTPQPHNANVLRDYRAITATQWLFV